MKSPFAFLNFDDSFSLHSDYWSYKRSADVSFIGTMLFADLWQDKLTEGGSE